MMISNLLTFFGATFVFGLVIFIGAIVVAVSEGVFYVDTENERK